MIKTEIKYQRIRLCVWSSPNTISDLINISKPKKIVIVVNRLIILPNYFNGYSPFSNTLPVFFCYQCKHCNLINHFNRIIHGLNLIFFTHFFLHFPRTPKIHICHFVNSYIGFVNYLACFIKLIANVTHKFWLFFYIAWLFL